MLLWFSKPKLRDINLELQNIKLELRNINIELKIRDISLHSMYTDGGIRDKTLQCNVYRLSNQCHNLYTYTDDFILRAF